MNRTVITRQDLARPPGPLQHDVAISEGARPQPDDWKTTLLKLLPAEVVGAYIAIDGLLKGGALPPSSSLYQALVWGVFGVLFVLNYFYLRPVVQKPRQLWLSVFAFPVWVGSLGGPFLYIGLEASTVHLLGSILLVLYTAVSVLVMRS